PSTLTAQGETNNSERKPTLLGLTKLTLGMGFEVDLLHLVVGDSLEQKVVVVSQLVAIFQLASTTVNKVLLNLQARGFWYKVFTGPPLVKQLVQASIVPASTSKARAKGCPTEAQKHLQLAGYVCNWLAFTNVGEEWSCWVLSTLVPFYSRLSTAMGRVGSHRHAVLETQALVSPLSPPKAQEVLVWQEKVKDVALEALGSFGPGEQLPTKVARVVRDASMLCTGFGHSSLAQRSQVMVTAKASQHAITPCGMPNCPGMAGGCKGNRFEYDGATAAWRLVVPHSKNSSKGVPGIVLPLTDTKEVKLLEAYECQARPVLLGQIGTHEHLVEAMYLNNKGQPYTIESLAMWWRRTYKLDNPDMPGPSIQAAAQAMLNSPAQWGASYDMNKRQRLGKEAQATMPLYRKAMLQASPKPLSNMAEGLAGVGQLGQAQQEGGVEEASFFTPCFSWVAVSSGRAFLFFCSWVGGVQAVPAATHVEDLVLRLLGWAIKGPQHQPDCSPREPRQDNAKLKDSKTAPVGLS
ncbi:hypothetical protein V8C86DRAFT_2445896, partial [Haematococcus lacustris]